MESDVDVGKILCFFYSVLLFVCVGFPVCIMLMGKAAQEEKERMELKLVAEGYAEYVVSGDEVEWRMKDGEYR